MPISTKISIEIDGERLHYFTELAINQKINEHHQFFLKQPIPREFVEHAAEKTMFYIGKSILITAESNFLKTESSLIFKGIVTNAEMVRNFGVASYILIKGYSPTVLLEGSTTIRSYSDKSVGDIANEVLNNYSKQQLRSTIAPKNSSSLPYTVQYNESDFSFLKRLAQKKSEWLFYNGTELFLSEPNKGNTYNLHYGNNVHSLKIDMKAQPLGFSFLGYEPSSADTQTVSSFELNHQTQGYAKSVFESSKKLFPETGTHLYSQPIAENGTMPHLSDRVQTQLESKTANLITLYAESDEPGLRLGDKVKITEPAFSPTNNPADGIKEQYFGEYIITQVTHHLDETGKYYNTFEAVPSSVQSPPYTQVLAHPHSGTQPATVIDNNDPAGLGRVKVKFSWQESDTPWLRMTNPHAGGGKGMYFIPEIGEEVLIGFEDNNTEKPFVLGAMYNGSESSGYATGGNDNKVIQSRSGTKIIMNDAAGSVFVEDPSGNTWFMDGQGNISVNAPKTFTVNCTDMDINVTNNKTINVGSNMTTSVGMNKTSSVGANSTETVGGLKSLSVGLDMIKNIIGKLTEIIGGDVHTETKGGKNVINSQKGIDIASSGTVNKHSDKEIQNNAAEKSKQY